MKPKKTFNFCLLLSLIAGLLHQPAAFADSRSDVVLTTGGPSSIYSPLPDETLPLPTGKIVDLSLVKEEDGRKILDFLNTESFSGNYFDRSKDPETDSVTYFWTPKMRLSTINPVTVFENSDIRQLYVNLTQLLSLLREKSNAASSQIPPSIRAAADVDPNYALDLLATRNGKNQSSSSMKNAITTLGFSGNATEDELDKVAGMFSRISREDAQKIQTLASIDLYTYASIISNPEATVSDLLYAIANGRRMIQRNMELSFKTGFTYEELSAFEAYKKLYPNIKFKQIRSDVNPIKVELNTPSNYRFPTREGSAPAPRPNDQSILALAMFNMADFVISTGATVVDIPVTTAGARAMDNLYERGQAMDLPLVMSQVVSFTTPLSAHVHCSFEHYLKQDIELHAFKNNDDSVYAPVETTAGPKEGNSDLCTITRGTETDELFNHLAPDEQKLTFNAILENVETQYRTEFGTRVQMSNALKDDLLKAWRENNQTKFKGLIPFITKSRLKSPSVAAYCAPYWESRCIVPKHWLLEGCLIDDGKTNPNCHDAVAATYEYYREPAPIDMFSKEVINNYEAYAKDYDFKKRDVKAMTVKLNASVCLINSGKAKGEFRTCATEEVADGTLNFKNEFVSGFGKKPLYRFEKIR